MYPDLFKIGPLTVHSFGALMALGFFVAASISAREYQRRGGDAEQMWNLLLYVFLGGLAGSKVLSLFNDVPAFFADPLHQIVSGSGFVWYGGLLGGLATAWFLHRRYQIGFSTILECTALGLPIGQAIGRLGCHIAGDGDWGIVTDVPWGVAYEKAVIGWDYPPGVTVHPTPLYEAAAYGLVFVVLYRLRKRDYPPPTLFAMYLLGASSARFLVEFIRINPKVVFGLTQAQLIAVVLIAAGAALLVRVRRSYPQMQAAR